MINKNINRRNFIKNACSTCGMAGLSILFGSSLFETGCKATASISVYKTTEHNNKVSIPLSAFDTTTSKLIRIQNYDYDVAIRKNSDNTFLALLLMCTHAGQALTKSGEGYYCTLHGSRFSKNGTVIKGPASRPLQHLKTIISGNNLIVTLEEPII